MNEKYGAIWVNFDDDDSSEIVEEYFSESLDKIFVVYKRKDGLFMPFSYIKKESAQWSLPFWSNENTKLLVASFNEAREYLVSYGLGRL